MRKLPTLTIVVALFAGGIAHAAEPLPVRPSVAPSFANGITHARLNQDLCYTWGAPQVSRTGNTVAVTQTVAPREQCLIAGPTIRNYLAVELGRFEAGSYRFTYAATGSSAFASYAFDFDVHAENEGVYRYMIQFEPANPNALEAVRAVIDLNECESVKGFRMGDRALEVVTEWRDGWCDVSHPRYLEIGSFPPGDYTLRVVRPDGAMLASKSFTVGPASATPPANNLYARDLSGIWSSPDEEPGTAIAFIHSADRRPDGTQRNGLTGIWYRYDAAGQPIWYLLELNAGAQYWSAYTGTVQLYAATNPAEPGFRRTIAGTARGTVTIDENPASGLPRLRGTVDGQEIDIGLRPFRWTRNSWGLGNEVGGR